jgi:hypothetical protein
MDGENVKIDYVLPVPLDGKMREPVGVLPMVTSGGPQGTIARTFTLAFALTF